MKKFFATRHYTGDIDFVLLLIRLFCGYSFIMHGWGKIQNPMGWMGPQASIPGIFQFLAAFSEFGGGIAIIFGLFTRLASLGMMITMIVAALTHLFVMGDPLISKGAGSAEPATIYTLVFLMLLIMGPGRFSADRKIFG